MDTFRHFHPEPHATAEFGIAFSQCSRLQNGSWRIDYINVTDPLSRHRDAEIYPDVKNTVIIVLFS